MMPLLTLNQHFDAALQRFAPDRVAFASEATPVTYGELRAMVTRLQAGLRAAGVGPKVVVGYSLPNCPEVIALFLALSRLGASAVPLFPMMPDSVRAGVFAALGCTLVVTAGPAVATLSQAAAQQRASYRVVELGELGAVVGNDGSESPELDPCQRLLAAASSGTTGAPKSVWMTQRNAAAVLTASADMARVGSWQDDPDFSSMIAFPLSTSSILVVLGFAFAGVRLIFARDPSPQRFLELAEQWNVDSLSAPPAYFEALLGLPSTLARPLPQVRAVMTGMDFLSPSLVSRLTARFPALDRAASGYGLVETSLVFMTWKAQDRAELKSPANVFRLCPGIDNQIDVRDEAGQTVPEGQPGELWVAGPSVVSGYLGRAPSDEGAAGAFVQGWFRTGDVARRLDASTIELCGRQKYLIKRGGKSVSPTEVQDCVEACRGVKACAVVGVKHPLYGEMVWAFVVVDDAGPAALTDIMKACRSSLPSYMVPDRVSFLAALPRGAGVGKLDREALIRVAEAELASIQGERHG